MLAPHRFRSSLPAALLGAWFLSLSSPPVLAASCSPATVDAASLAVDLPCVSFNGQRYRTRLTAESQAGQPLPRWRLDPTVLGASACAPGEASCAVLGNDLALTLRGAQLGGGSFDIHLTPAPDASVPSGLFWRYVSHAAATSAASIGPACNAGSGKQTVSFVHVGDLHANFDPSGADKYSRIRAYYQKVQQANPYTVFTNAGDDHEKGSVAEVLSQGAAVTEATRAMQFDVRTLGNHDFAWGESHLLEHSRDPKSLVLLSNTTYSGSDPRGLGSVPFGVLQVGCVRVGFVGSVSPPWNELDEYYYGDYFPAFHTDFNDTQVIANLIAAHRGEYDVLVMVSHLGIETDRIVAAGATGIDLVLGGHSHYGASVEKIGDTVVVQPNFYADGVTRVDLEVDLASRKVTGYQRTEQDVAPLTDIDATVHQSLQAIVARHAPEAQTTLGYLEKAQTADGIATIAGRAGIAKYQADAAFLDPARINAYKIWSAGDLTQQKLIDAYWVERQQPGTPGISSQYLVEVSGATLTQMRTAKPRWAFVGPASIDPQAIYKVIVNKAPALQPAKFFPASVSLSNVRFLGETWEALDTYVRNRTTQCLHVDSDTKPAICQATSSGGSVWTFAGSNPLQADQGKGSLSYRDLGGSGWGGSKTSFGTAAGFSLPALADSNAKVMKIASTAPDQGYLLTHGESASGDYASQGLLGNYTLVLDMLWPSASDGKWRALLQADGDNSTDADWYVEAKANGGIGIGSYFGNVPANTWKRLAIVARAADSGGSLSFYIDGVPVGSVNNANKRWAVGKSFLLFADDSYETEVAYVGGILFTGYAMSDGQLKTLGAPTQALRLP